MVVTEQCLLSHTRNPHLGREGIERELKVWLAYLMLLCQQTHTLHASDLPD